MTSVFLGYRKAGVRPDSVQVLSGTTLSFCPPASGGAYLGPVPSEHSSGESRRQGGITKTGNSHARRLLVEAAWR